MPLTPTTMKFKLCLLHIQNKFWNVICQKTYFVFLIYFSQLFQMSQTDDVTNFIVLYHEHEAGIF